MHLPVGQHVSWKAMAEGVFTPATASLRETVLGPKADLRRIIYYGEALRAVSVFISESLIAGPADPMVELLADAFERLEAERPGFSPEEFSLYFMSVLLGLTDDADESRQIQRGSAQYIVKSAEVLPPEFGPIVADAKALLEAAIYVDDALAPPADDGPEGDVGVPEPQVQPPAVTPNRALADPGRTTPRPAAPTETGAETDRASHEEPQPKYRRESTDRLGPPPSATQQEYLFSKLARALVVMGTVAFLSYVLLAATGVSIPQTEYAAD